jgi:hypothetical protein
MIIKLKAGEVELQLRQALVFSIELKSTVTRTATTMNGTMSPSFDPMCFRRFFTAATVSPTTATSLSAILAEEVTRHMPSRLSSCGKISVFRRPLVTIGLGDMKNPLKAPILLLQVCQLGLPLLTAFEVLALCAEIPLQDFIIDV